VTLVMEVAEMPKGVPPLLLCTRSTSTLPMSAAEMVESLKA